MGISKGKQAFDAAKETFNWKFFDILVIVVIVVYPKLVLNNVVIRPAVEGMNHFVNRILVCFPEYFFNLILTFMLIELHNYRIRKYDSNLLGIISKSLMKIPKVMPMFLVLAFLEIVGYYLAFFPGLIFGIIFWFAYYIFYDEELFAC